MRFAVVTLIIFAVVGLAGCQRFEQPTYSEDQLVACPDLAGFWVVEDDEDGEFGLEISVTSTERLIVYITDADYEGNAIEVNPFVLNDQLFWDSSLVAFDDVHRGIGIEVAIHMLPLHLLWKVDYDEESLTLSYLTESWTSKYLIDHPASLDHRWYEESAIVTAETQEIQDFISNIAMKYIPDPDVPSSDWGDSSEVVFNHWATFIRAEKTE